VDAGAARAGGAALLAAGAVLTAVLVREAADLVAHAESRRAFTSSSLIFGLIQLALCGMCWHAGYRLAFGKPDRSGTLFSRPVLRKYWIWDELTPLRDLRRAVA